MNDLNFKFVAHAKLEWFLFLWTDETINLKVLTQKTDLLMIQIE